MPAEKGWKFNLFKKKYPSWIYYIIFTLYSLVLFLWLWNKYF
jgi:hypothetical protein